MKICTVEEYDEQEQKKSNMLGNYSIQDLESQLMSSGKNYAFEFLRHFRDYKGGLLAQIKSSGNYRAKSQNAISGKLNYIEEEKIELSNNSFLEDNRQLTVLKNRVFYENNRKYSWFKKRKIKIAMTESNHKRNWKLPIRSNNP